MGSQTWLIMALEGLGWLVLLLALRLLFVSWTLGLTLVPTSLVLVALSRMLAFLRGHDLKLDRLVKAIEQR